MTNEKAPPCTSLVDVIDDLLQVLPIESQAKFAAIPLDHVVGRCHHGLGQYIRNRYLWSNPNLVTACGTHHPDSASSSVLEALWHRLHPEVEASTCLTG